MKRMTRQLLALTFVLLPFACVDREPLGPGGIQNAAIYDVEGFHFLAPIGHGTSAAGFLGTLSPTVTICPASGGCSTPVAQFTLTAGTGGTTIQVSLEDNVYQVDWNTTGTATGSYRAIVELGGELLGSADIVLVANSGQAKKAAPGTFAVVSGRTLPIKFGIELAALLEISGADPDVIVSNDFVVETFNDTDPEQFASVPSGDAAFQVDGTNVQIPGGGTEFTLLIYETPTQNGKCVTSYPGPNSGGCYVFETIPEGVTFLDGDGNPAGLGGVCPDEFVTDIYRLAKEDDGTTTFPDPAQQSVVDCNDIALDRVPRLLRPLARLFLPSPVHALDLGETGTMGAFSTLFWAVPLAIEENPADALPTGPFTAGQTLSLSFRVMSTHPASDPPVPVSGVTVSFTIPAGGGTLSVADDVSDNLGVVNVDWTLSTPGFTLTATIQGAYGEDDQPLTFEFSPATADIIVWNDVNTFDNTGMADADNVTLVQNLVNFSGTGSRAAGTTVLIDRGRSSTVEGLIGSGFAATVTGAGFTLVSTSSSPTTAPLTTIAAGVKVLFLVGPGEAFTTAEVNALKQFAAEGGRIVLLGENTLVAAVRAVQNSLLTALGSAATNIGGQLDCGAHRQTVSGQLGTHQVTTGVGGLSYTCMSALSLAAGDVALLMDGGLATATDLLQPDGRAADPCDGDCVLAAVTKISTTPLTPPVIASIPGAAAGFELQSSVRADVLELTTGIRR